MPRRIWKQTSYRLKPLWEGRGVLLFFGLLFTALSAFAVVYPPELIRLLNHRTYDTMLTGRPVPAGSDVPVLVAIDEQSLQAFGQWPWPRYRIAQMIERLRDLGAAAIALDMLMPEVDRTSLDVIFAERARDLDESYPACSFARGEGQNDQTLAAALRATPSILGYKLLFDGLSTKQQSLPEPLRQVVVRHMEGAKDNWPRASGIIASRELLFSSARAGGFINAKADPDGLLRRIPLLLSGDPGYYPSLALSALLMTRTDNELRINRLPGGTSLELNGRQIPLDEQGNLLLAFRGRQKSFEYLSAADVLAGKLPDNHLAGKIAFVGAWAAGLGDRHVTPFDSAYPGLEIHATVVDGILTGNFISIPGWAAGAEFFFVVLIGLFSTLVLVRFGFLSTFLLLVCVGVSVFLGAVMIFRADGVYVSPVLPILVLLINTSVLSLLKYGIEAQKVFVRTRALVHAQDATIIGMTALAETRDEETGEHILRTQHYVEVLARRLSTQEKYKKDLNDEVVELMFKSAPLHDIGKVGIPDGILCKQGDLTEDEYQIMKSHTLIGARALDKAFERVDDPEVLAFLHYARQMAEAHHEKWDGSGYPHGLSGQDIPLAGRLMSLADIYDAVISKRVYKPAFPHEEAKRIILGFRGTALDPAVVDVFLECEAAFRQIAIKYADPDEREEVPVPLS